MHGARQRCPFGQDMDQRAALKRLVADVPRQEREPEASLEGRIVVDVCNPYIEKDGQLLVADLGERASSDVVASLVPGAKLVKAFNTLLAAVLSADPKQAGGRRVIFVSGDDDGAKAELKAIIEAVGWAPIDLGGLATGGRLQQGRGLLSGANLIRLA
jgi:predicted dinucleotide-binding enzyme